MLLHRTGFESPEQTTEWEKSRLYCIQRRFSCTSKDDEVPLSRYLIGRSSLNNIYTDDVRALGSREPNRNLATTRTPLQVQGKKTVVNFEAKIDLEPGRRGCYREAAGRGSGCGTG
jgi:hypothetical protein